MLLDRLSHDKSWPEIWPQLIHADTLWSLLFEHRRDGLLLQDVRDWIGEKQDPHVLREFRSKFTPIDRVIFEAGNFEKDLRDVLSFVEGAIAWESGGAVDGSISARVAASFRRADRSAGVTRSGEIDAGCLVPVVSYEIAPGDTSGSGRVCLLQLEAWDSSAGTLVDRHHIRDYFATKPDPRFRSAMNAAWGLAAASRGSDGGRVGVWRLLDSTGSRPELKANGDSAGCAALFGWSHCLSHTRPDPRVLVMGCLEVGDGSSPAQFATVGDVPQKAEVVANALVGKTKVQIDTIAVAEIQATACWEGIKKADAVGRIRVAKVFPDFHFEYELTPPSLNVSNNDAREPTKPR